MAATSSNAAPAVDRWGRPVRHFNGVVRQRGEYIADCSCGAAFEPHAARQLAEMDRREHLADVADVPAGQRCRDPKRHKTDPVQRCALCADQLELDFTDEIGDLR